MRGLFWLGVSICVLGIASLVVPIRTMSAQASKSAVASIGIETRHEEKVSPIISAVFDRRRRRNDDRGRKRFPRSSRAAAHLHNGASHPEHHLLPLRKFQSCKNPWVTPVLICGETRPVGPNDALWSLPGALREAEFCPSHAGSCGGRRHRRLRGRARGLQPTPERTPTDTGMAFRADQHLDPKHASQFGRGPVQDHGDARHHRDRRCAWSLTTST